MAGQDYCTERGEAEEDKAEDGVDEAEGGRADALGDEANDDDQRGEPGHQAGGHLTDGVTGHLVGTTRSRVSHFMNKFKKLGFVDYKSLAGGLTVNSSLSSVVLHD
jgi:hypothetical protein